MKTVAPVLPEGIRVVAELTEAVGSRGAGRVDGAGQDGGASGGAADPVLHVNPDWATELPWVVQGVTGRDADMSLFGGSRTADVVPRWQRLRDRLGFSSIVHARQVHRDNVLVHTDTSAGLVIAADADGHATRLADALLAVSVADCVPVSVAAPGARAVALLHGGWRGIAAGILEAGVSALATSFSAAVDDLHVHLGPAICGECYQVSPDVPLALGLDSHRVSHVDIRAALAARAIALGIAPSRITVSAHCTRHGDSPFYSHRGGCAERQIAVIGIRTP